LSDALPNEKGLKQENASWSLFLSFTFGSLKKKNTAS